MTFIVFIGLASQKEKRKPVAAQSEIGNLGRLKLKLELVCDKGDKSRIGRLSLGIADGITEKSLQSIQVASVSGYLGIQYLTFSAVQAGHVHQLSAWLCGPF